MQEKYQSDLLILFDVNPSQLNPKPGEKHFLQSKEVEDAKGNAGEDGAFTISNLRIIWYCIKDPTINLSIGLGTIFQYEKKLPLSHSQKAKQVLTLRTRMKTSRYEFNFQTESRDIFELFEQVLSSYQKSSIFREVKVSTSIISNKSLNLLPKETIFNKILNCRNITNDKQALTQVDGCLFLTNVRFAWFSLQHENFNISVPWIAVKRIQKKAIKSVSSLVIECHAEMGGYLIGYQVAEEERTMKEMERLKELYQDVPIYGVEIAGKQQSVVSPNFSEQVQCSDVPLGRAYSTYAQGQEEKDLNIVFSPELGVAMQQLPPQVKIKDLWQIIQA